MRTLTLQRGEKKHPSLRPNLPLSSDYRPQWPDHKRTDLSLPPFHCICCVYFLCILNLSPFKGVDNVCDLSARRRQLQAATINGGRRTSARRNFETPPPVELPMSFDAAPFVRKKKQKKKTLNSANPSRRNSEWRKFSMISCPG